MKKYNLIELYGHCEAHFILVDPAFDLDKDNDEMLNIDWDNEPLKHYEFFSAEKLIKFCRENDVHIDKSYWGKIY